MKLTIEPGGIVRFDPDDSPSDVTWNPGEVGKFLGGMVYSDTNPYVGTWWIINGKWQHEPYTGPKPRPWKLHQSRFRQRKH